MFLKNFSGKRRFNFNKYLKPNFAFTGLSSYKFKSSLHNKRDYENNKSKNQEMEQKINNDFDYNNCFRPNNFDQFRIKQIGLNNVSNRQFSTRVNVIDNKSPEIQTGGDFAKLVTKSTIFADKSLFIQEIISHEEEVILITMPRRWGKSVNMDMLKRFLEIKRDENENPIKKEDRIKELNYKLFFGGEIDRFGMVPEKIHLSPLDIAEVKQIKYSDLQGQYPVIFIDFKDCGGSNFTEIESIVKDKIVKLYRDHGYLLKSKKIYNGYAIKDLYQEYFKKIEDIDISAIYSSVLNLSELISKHFDKKVWILIDEYDSPLNSAFVNFGKEEFSTETKKFKKDGDFQKTFKLFRSIMSSALKGNENLDKGVLTGVLSSAESSMLSGLNNVIHYNLLKSKYTKYYGFDKEEIADLIKHFKTGEDVTRISNGYRYGNIDGVYNTWSTVCYFNSKDETFINEEWTKSGGFDLLEDMILKNTNDVQSSLNQLVSGQPLSFIIKPDIEYRDLILGKIDKFLSILLWTGYLTPTNKENEVKIPNEPIKKSIQQQIINWVENFVSKEDSENIFSYLQDKEIFQEKLKTAFIKISHHDFREERDYHNIMNGMMMMLSDRYSVVSNIEAGKGRLDNAVYDKNEKIGYIFEYKYVKTESKEKVISTKGEEALRQIETKEYFQYFKTHNYADVKDIIYIAIVFESKTPHVFWSKKPTFKDV